MTEIKKYVVRFGLILLITLPLLLFTQGANAIRIITYKVCMVTVGIGLCELIWAVFYKTVYGASERASNPEAAKAILMFRGILYGAIILALTLGL